MAATAPATLKSVLCSGLWTWSPDYKCTVKFNEDGTGDLCCGVEFNIFIASQFDWEMRSNAESGMAESPARAEVAMTLTKRDLVPNNRPIKHTALSDAAFEQKVYHLELEKGAFKVENRTTHGSNPTYEYRLLWDKSPYPPLEEWNRRGPAEAGQYWERRDFYKDKVDGTG